MENRLLVIASPKMLFGKLYRSRFSGRIRFNYHTLYGRAKITYRILAIAPLSLVVTLLSLTVRP